MSVDQMQSIVGELEQVLTKLLGRDVEISVDVSSEELMSGVLGAGEIAQ